MEALERFEHFFQIRLRAANAVIADPNQPIAW